MTRTTLALFAIAIILAIFGTYYLTKKSTDQPPTAQVTPQAQPAVQQPGKAPSVASGKDTIAMIFNKQSAQEILGALQNQFPTPQNAPQLTVGQFIATQGVFNYLEGMIYKKWPDLVPKPAAPTPPPAANKK